VRLRVKYESRCRRGDFQQEANVLHLDATARSEPANSCSPDEDPIGQIFARTDVPVSSHLSSMSVIADHLTTAR